MNDLPAKSDDSAERLALARDVGILQLKLIVDGLRDLLLVPASIIAGVLSLLSSEKGRPGPYFYQLLELGKQSEHWINLFGALRNAPADLKPVDTFPEQDLDDLVGRLETFMVEEHKRGGITAQARRRLDRALKTVREKRSGGG